MAKGSRVKRCLKCGHRVILQKGFFLCESCRKSNANLEDLESVYLSHLAEALRIFRSERYA